MSKEVKRYEALRDAAKKATPGPWRIEDDEDSAAGAVYITQDTPDWREPIARLYGWHDQNYLELADPTTILELLAERDALLAERDALRNDHGSMRNALKNARYRIEQGRVWNGMGWTLTGLHAHQQQKALDEIDAALQGAQP